MARSHGAVQIAGQKPATVRPNRETEQVMFDLEDELALDQATEVLKFLADKNRLRILSVLARQDSNVGELISLLSMPQSLVSYHLGKLRAMGLVRSRRQAQWVFYSLEHDAWRAFVSPLSAVIEPSADSL
jgi:ArsR family transcriptional regulator